MILRSDPTVLNFLEEALHVEAASRVSFQTVMGSVNSLVNGINQIQEEIRILKKMQISPVGDRFISIMEVFIHQAEPAISALKTMGAQLDSDLKSLLQYYGEDLNQSKPDVLFGIIVSFSNDLLVSSFCCFLTLTC